MSKSIKYTRLFQIPKYCPYCGSELVEENDFKKACPKCEYYYWDVYKENRNYVSIIKNLKIKYNDLRSALSSMRDLVEGCYYSYYDSCGNYCDDANCYLREANDLLDCYGYYEIEEENK